MIHNAGVDTGPYMPSEVKLALADAVEPGACVGNLTHPNLGQDDAARRATLSACSHSEHRLILSSRRNAVSALPESALVAIIQTG